MVCAPWTLRREESNLYSLGVLSTFYCGAERVEEDAPWTQSEWTTRKHSTMRHYRKPKRAVNSLDQGTKILHPAALCDYHFSSIICKWQILNEMGKLIYYYSFFSSGIEVGKNATIESSTRRHKCAHVQCTCSLSLPSLSFRSLFLCGWVFLFGRHFFSSCFANILRSVPLLNQLRTHFLLGRNLVACTVVSNHIAGTEWTYLPTFPSSNWWRWAKLHFYEILPKTKYFVRSVFRKKPRWFDPDDNGDSTGSCLCWSQRKPAGSIIL